MLYLPIRRFRGRVKSVKSVWSHYVIPLYRWLFFRRSPPYCAVLLDPHLLIHLARTFCNIPTIFKKRLRLVYAEPNHNVLDVLRNLIGYLESWKLDWLIWYILKYSFASEKKGLSSSSNFNFLIKETCSATSYFKKSPCVLIFSLSHTENLINETSTQLRK